MKRTTKYLLAFLFLTIIFLACKKDNPAPADGLFVSQLYKCSGDKNSNPVYICFDSLLSDNRCPAYANCLGPLFGLIKISFHENGNTHTFKMITAYVPKSFGTNDTTINGYHLVFKDLEPHPDFISNVPISNDDRKATIEITR